MIKEVSDGTIDDSHRFVLIADLSGEAVLREAVEECVRLVGRARLNSIVTFTRIGCVLMHYNQHYKGIWVVYFACHLPLAVVECCV